MDKAKDKKSSKKSKKDVKDNKSDKNKEKNVLPLEIEELTDKRAEPYICTGNFFIDFDEICQRNAINLIPEIVQRTKWPVLGQPAVANIVTMGPDKNKLPQKGILQIPEAEVEIVEPSDDNGEAPPKTFILREGYDYFKPRIQYEIEVKERPETVSEIYIRGWKVDDKYLKIFQKCWVAMERLSFISFWNAGLDQSSISTLASFLPKCVNLKKLYIDANYIKYSNYGELLQKDSNIQFLSLRHCQITDYSLESITHAINDTEAKLISLNLTGNFITDVGAKYLAHALRKNQTLLDLELASNQIGDEGAKLFAMVLSRFALSQDEIFERRKLIMEKQIEEARNPVGNEMKSAKDTSGKDDDKGGKSRKEKEEKGSGSAATSSVAGSSLVNTPGAGGSCTAVSLSISSANIHTLSKKFSLASKEMAKMTKNLTSHRSWQLKILGEAEEQPRIGFVEYDEVDKQLWVLGNKVLKSLDLSRNKITSLGIKALLDSMKQQQDHIQEPQIGVFPGLVSLKIKRNLAPESCFYTIELNDLMANRDPLRKYGKDDEW